MTLEKQISLAERVSAFVMQKLPPDLREAAKHCAVNFTTIEEARAADSSLESDLLGLFEGNSRLEPQPETPDELPRVRLFLDNLWDFCEGDATAFREEIRITLLHELGHYLGLNEAQVEALGLA
jgi:predicted Zn-dependent protease with MMP-like domain